MSETAWLAYFPMQTESKFYKYIRFDKDSTEITHQIISEKEKSIKPLSRGNGHFR